MRYLLDKNIIRYTIAGLHYGRQRTLSSLELGALTFWMQAKTAGAILFISPASLHVLQQMTDNREVRFVLDAVDVLLPTRYHTRWAR